VENLACKTKHFAHLPLKQEPLEESPVTKNSIFDYARVAARAEQRIVELLDKSLEDELPDSDPDADLQQSARPRQGPDPSG